MHDDCDPASVPRRASFRSEVDSKVASYRGGNWCDLQITDGDVTSGWMAEKLRHHRAYLTTKESWPKVATWTPTKSLKHDITDKKTLIWNPLNFTQWSTTCQQVWRVKGMLVPWAPLCDLQVLQPLLCARTTINCKAAWTQRPDVLSRACCARTTTHYDKTVVLWHRGATSSSFRGGAIFTNFHSMTSSCLFNRRKRSQIEFSSQHFWKLQLFCLKGHSMSNELKKWRSQPTISDFPQIS